MSADWVVWHDGYDVPGTLLRDRLDVVRHCLRSVLESMDSPVRVLSLCAGDGRDVIPVVAALEGRLEVSVRLIELSPVLVERALVSAEVQGVGISVIAADAGAPWTLAKEDLADVLLLCGIFGNVSDDDVRNTVEHAGALVRRGGTVIWTRHRRPPDLTVAIRDWFRGEGFEELGFQSPGGNSWSVGVHRNVSAEPRAISRQLFRFAR